ARVRETGRRRPRRHPARLLPPDSARAGCGPRRPRPRRGRPDRRGSRGRLQEGSARRDRRFPARAAPGPVRGSPHRLRISARAGRNTARRGDVMAYTELTVWTRGIIMDKEGRDIVNSVAASARLEGRFAQAMENYVDNPDRTNAPTRK